MWVVSSVNLKPPFVSVRRPPAPTVIDPSTVYTIPVHTCALVITQFPLIAGPGWSHVCAVAGGANINRAPTKLPIAVRTTIKTLTDIRASEPRFVMAHTSERAAAITTSRGWGAAAQGAFFPGDAGGLYIRLSARLSFPGTRDSHPRKHVHPSIESDLSSDTNENAHLRRNEGEFAGFFVREVPLRRVLDDLLLEDLLRGSPALLRGLVLVLRREPVPAGVAHDRVRGDHRPARGARDLSGIPLRRLLLEPVPAGVAHARVRSDHRPARGARDLSRFSLRLHLRGLGLRLGCRADGLRHRPGDGL